MNVLERLQELCNIKGISITALCLAATGNKGNLATWKNNGGNMRSDYLLKCADILGVSTDFLLGRGLVDNCVHQYNVNVEFSKIFNHNTTLTKYVFSLWEALNEIYSSHELLEDMLNINPFRRQYDWLTVFKYIAIVLCEAAKLITLQDKEAEFENARSVLLENSKAKSSYDKFVEFWGDENNSGFFIDIRNNIAHYDHTKNNNNNYYANTIKELNKYTLFLNHNILSDADEPLFAKVMIEIYNNYYNNTDKSNKKDNSDADIIKLYSKLCEYTIELLRNMVDSFLERFTFISDNDNEIQTLRLRDEKLTIHNTGNNVGFVGQANAPVTVINGTEKKSSEQEIALMNIFEKLDVIKQAQLLTYAVNLEKEV